GYQAPATAGPQSPSVIFGPEPVTDTAADDLEVAQGQGEGGEDDAKLECVELQFLADDGRQRGDIHAIHVEKEIHQAPRREHLALSGSCHGFWRFFPVQRQVWLAGRA